MLTKNINLKTIAFHRYLNSFLAVEFNPLLHSVAQEQHLTEISILK